MLTLDYPQRAALAYVAALALMAIPLAGNVSVNRRRAKVGIMDGGDAKLAQAIRVHGNFSEYAPLAAVLLVAEGVAGASGWAVHATGLAIVAGRLSHAYGLSHSTGYSPGRYVGTLLTFASFAIGALTLLWQAFAG
ncbi:MAG: MAPEG family protein [Hyphomicrobiales bacterium]|nr:MAPEG family protein [Hyphomicrobiales bacterium]MDE2018143.1 MAPEG family protein [Hyphomicrobiales bacterium]